MKKFIKVVMYILGIIIIFLICYVGYDRIVMPPAPSSESITFNLNDKWEQYAQHYVDSHPGSNALQNYLKAFSMIPVDKRDYPMKEMDSVLKVGWQGNNPKIEEYAAKYQEAFKEVIQGAEMKNCVLPPSPYDFMAPVPDLLRVQTIGKMFAVFGKKSEAENRYSEAVQYYLDGIQFGRDIGQKDQFLISRLIGIAIMTINTKPLSRLMSEGKLGEGDYKKILTEVNRIEQEQPTGLEILQHEQKAYYWEIYRKSENSTELGQMLGMVNQTNPKLLEKLFTRGYFFLNRGKVLRNANNYAKEINSLLSNKSYPELVAVNWNSLIPHDFINRMASPNIFDAYARNALTINRLRILKLQAAIELYHIQKGTWPKSMGDLKEYVPTIPTDLFTGKPLMMETSVEVPYVTSPGPSGKESIGSILYDPTNGTYSEGQLRT